MRVQHEDASSVDSSLSMDGQLVGFPVSLFMQSCACSGRSSDVHVDLNTYIERGRLAVTVEPKHIMHGMQTMYRPYRIVVDCDIRRFFFTLINAWSYWSKP